jgi:hypothetical protein
MDEDACVASVTRLLMQPQRRATSTSSSLSLAQMLFDVHVLGNYNASTKLSNASVASSEASLLPLYIACQHSSKVRLLPWMHQERAGDITADATVDVAPKDAQPNECQSHVDSYAQGGGRGFLHAQDMETPATVHVIYDKLKDEEDLRKLLLHELTHAIDVGKHGMDLSRSGYLACSEGRAAAQAECVDSMPLLRRRCVRLMATQSTQLVFPEEGKTAVEAVLSECMNTPLLTNPKTTPTLIHVARAIEAAAQQPTNKTDTTVLR